MNESLDVVYLKTISSDHPEFGFPKPEPLSRILPEGSVNGDDAYPLPCDILFEQDVQVTLRDGARIYTDVFRPVTGEKVPAIICWSPYGKKLHRQPFPWYAPGIKLSNLQKFEAPDPGFFCKHGYAVINPDARGAFNSEGDICFLDSQEGRDGYDLIEWLAVQDWCNGKIALGGNSWLAVVQWHIAAQQPPHLAAIAPWESFIDPYRDLFCRGGIPESAFLERMLKGFQGNQRVESVHEMLEKYPFMNEYWESKIPDLKKVEVPAYVTGSYTNLLHPHGTFHAFRNISSKEKWLRVHNDHEWADLYRNQEDLLKFYDYHLKGIENDWPNTPRVRLSVLNPGGKDIENRPEKEFPLKRTIYRKLFLDADNCSLSAEPVTETSKVKYSAIDGLGQVQFTMKFQDDIEITGYMKLHLWVEALDADDMDLFVFIQKLDEDGNMLAPVIYGAPYSGVCGGFFYGASGRLRVSHRRLEEDKSSEAEPYLMHRRAQYLSPCEIVPVDIPIWPMGMKWSKGEQIRVLVSAYNIQPPEFPNLCPMQTCNKGSHIIHTGGEHDSYLYIPSIPNE